MAWKLIGTPRTQQASKRLAEEFMNMDPAPHDRPLSERRLQVYRRLISTNSFRPVTWASAFCKETGGTYRVNGKHTSTIFASLPPEALSGTFITVERYHCDTLEEVAHLYSTFDSKMTARSTADINASFAGCVSELANLPVRNVNVIVSGMAFHIHGDARKASSAEQPPERAERLMEHPEFVVWCSGILGGTEQKKPANHGTRHMKRTAVVAAMFGTYQRDSREATKFWEAVRDESDHPASKPTRKLAHYLVANFSLVGKKVGSHRIPDREVYVKCLHGWNAWRKGETTALQYHAAAELPSIR